MAERASPVATSCFDVSQPPPTPPVHRWNALDPLNRYPFSLLALALSLSRFGAPPRATGGRRRRIHSHRPPLALPMSSGAPSRPHGAAHRRTRPEEAPVDRSIVIFIPGARRSPP